jgi:phosphate transport system protein
MSTGDHSSKVYDQELEAIRSRVLQMGGLVESQLKLAIEAFESGDLSEADRVVSADRRVNDLEIELDRAVNNVIARRQPAASDLRMIMGVSRTIPDLERIGDEATKIARAWPSDIHAKQITVRAARAWSGHPGTSRRSALRECCSRSLDAFARLDVNAAAARGHAPRTRPSTSEFRAILRQLITFMMEDPRTITTSIDRWSGWPRRWSASATTPRTSPSS